MRLLHKGHDLGGEIGKSGTSGLDRQERRHQGGGTNR
jgi:hypothetical protein